MDKKLDIAQDKTLLPALMQCFGIMLLGYILGKIKVLRQNEAQGLAIFVQYLSLPALIFSSVSIIPFNEMKWNFIATVFVAKTCVFIGVILISILLTHPLHLGKAGMYAIAATQSNDFALGYPLLLSLYQSTHPEYTMYLYIIAPIQLLLLNGIGFFCIEIEKQNNRNSRWRSCNICHLCKEIFKNPVVIMTIAGLTWNVVYGQKVPSMLDVILKTFSAAFPATALLLLGYTMNLNNRSSSHISLSVALIILAKNLVLPILLQKFSVLMMKTSSNDDTESISSFAFLYGTIPTAPTVYVFATHYKTCVDVIAKTVVGSTLISTVLMFSTASVISLAQVGFDKVSFYMTSTISYLSLVNTFCCIWLLMLFCIGKRWRSVSFGIIIYLALAQLLSASGGLLLFFTPSQNTTLYYVQYVLTSGSTYATRMCTTLLASLLLIIRVRSLCFILHMKKKINWTSIIICLVLPYVLATSLIFKKDEETYGPNYQLGYIHIVTNFALTLVTLMCTILCLILQRIYSKKNVQNITIQNETQHQNPNLGQLYHPVPTTSSQNKCNGHKGTCCDIEDIGKTVEIEICRDDEPILSEVEINVCDSNYSCSVVQRYECAVQVSRYIDENQEIGTGISDNEHFLTHIGLLITLCVAMILSLSVCFWKLVMEDTNGIFIELEFLDVIVNYSLGIIFFIMFGFDDNLLSIIYIKWKLSWNKLFSPDIENNTQINQDSISEQFIINYYEKCRRALSKTETNNVFTHENLAEWILQENLVQTVDEADKYIKCLLIDHVIEKVYEGNIFSKNVYLLKFTCINLHSEEMLQ